MNVPRFISPLSVGQIGCFQFFVMKNSTTMNLYVRRSVFLSILCLFPLDTFLEKLLGRRACHI